MITDANISLIRLTRKLQVLNISPIGLFGTILNKNIMECNVKQRVLEILQLRNITINAISKKTGYPQSNLNKQINGETSMSVNTLIVLLEYFSDISANWLLRGEGEMLKSDELQSESNDSISDAYVKALESENKLLKKYIDLIKYDLQNIMNSSGLLLGKLNAG